MWDDVDRRIAENDAEGAVPLRTLLRQALAESGAVPVASTKKMIGLDLPSGQRMTWELSGLARGFYLGVDGADALRQAGFAPDLRPFNDGARNASLNTAWAFPSQACLQVRIDGVEELNRLLQVMATLPGSHLTREVVEAAMDQLAAAANPIEAPGFWVRSSRPRAGILYPVQPLMAVLPGGMTTEGWDTASGAAARLHNAGFVITDAEGQPLAPPDKPYLVTGADRIRACALTYFVAPARETGATEVAIRASDLARLMGLANAFPNICQALGGKTFQERAGLPPPEVSGPNPSSTTLFTFRLSPRTQARTEPQMSQIPTTNLILYGPPGTGKTYATAWEAVRLCLGADAEPLRGDRPAVMAAYHRLVEEGRIAFTTFHQSMSYEEFVEGLRPETGEGEEAATGFRLTPVPGLFTQIARRAEASKGRRAEGRISTEGRNFYKMSIGEASNPDDAALFEDAIAGGYTVLGWADVDWSDPKYADRNAILAAVRAQGGKYAEATMSSGSVKTTNVFRNAMKLGDVVIVSKGNFLVRAIGLVIGGYEHHPRPEGEYGHRRAVRWIWVDREGVPVSEIYSRNFTMNTLYYLDPAEINRPALERYLNSATETQDVAPEPFVLIIDEINRANVSKVLGELITLLEPDKRIGAPGEIRLQLPYSKRSFGVPQNLHVIGTMNTADRSIALLDTALRRRFTFRELAPDPSVLGVVDGLDLSRLLTTLNDRIEYLFDREHRIGHAYFTACKTRADVEEVMRHKVIPLLAEYFYEDWSKVAAVLGDGRDGPGRFLEAQVLVPPPGLEDDGAERIRWQVKAVFSFEGLVG